MTGTILAADDGTFTFEPTDPTELPAPSRGTLTAALQDAADYAAQPSTDLRELADTLRHLRERVFAEREAMAAAAKAAGDHLLPLNPVYSSRAALWSALLTAEDVALVALDVDSAAAA